MPVETIGEESYEPALVSDRADTFVVLSGCSGAGKSSLLAELGRRGFAVCEEPGRQVVKEQLFIGGDALPWDNVVGFMELTVSRSIHAMVSAARMNRLTFFDRGIIDQVAGMRHLDLAIPEHVKTAAKRCRYRQPVFVLPPWREIFKNDRERRHSFDDAVAWYATLLRTYGEFGYRTVSVPRCDIAERADFVLNALSLDGSSTATPNVPGEPAPTASRARDAR